MIRARWQESQIYTSVSSILVSVNPFNMLGLYTPAVMEQYRANAREMPPHVFQARSWSLCFEARALV